MLLKKNLDFFHFEMLCLSKSKKYWLIFFYKYKLKIIYYKKNMKSNTPKSLDQIKDNSKILNLDEKNILELARVSSISQLLSISKWENIIWINNEKVINTDTIEISNFIIEKIKTILNEDINSIKKSKIEKIVKKIWDELIKSADVEDYIIWTYIQKISNQISNIHLRYERKKSFLDRKNLSEHNEKLKIDNNTDPLTWLLNRKWITTYINDAIEEKNRDWTNYSAMLIDIDLFKSINDIYGHNVWDIALKEISKLLKSEIRWYDKVCRWWWEEFLILIKWSSTNKAESLRKKIENELTDNINLENNSKKITYSITVSIWITSINEGDNIISITDRADDWLYKVKNAWRNWVVTVKKKNMMENEYQYSITWQSKSKDNYIEYNI